MTRDETLFLPIWHRYYARLFGAENLFIIDHNSDETPARILGTASLNVFRLPFDAPSQIPEGDQWAFDRERFRFISDLITGLLKYYDTVIFNDTDEVFVPDPAVYPDLRACVMAQDDHVLAGVGLEIFHDPEEAPFDPARSVLAQRRNYVYRFHHSKPYILTRPCQIGGHGSKRPFRLDPDLYLMHLKFMDRGKTLQRQEKLFGFFQEGRGGPNSRWRLDVREMERQLLKMAALPRIDGFGHRARFERWLGVTGRPAEQGGWIVGRAGTKRFVQLTKFLPPDELRAAQAVRRALPARFARVQV